MNLVFIGEMRVDRDEDDEIAELNSFFRTM